MPVTVADHDHQDLFEEMLFQCHWASQILLKALAVWTFCVLERGGGKGVADEGFGRLDSGVKFFDGLPV